MAMGVVPWRSAGSTFVFPNHFILPPCLYCPPSCSLPWNFVGLQMLVGYREALSLFPSFPLAAARCREAGKGAGLARGGVCVLMPCVPPLHSHLLVAKGSYLTCAACGSLASPLSLCRAFI